MMMSPAPKCSASADTVCPVIPAGTITQAARGVESFAANSASVVAPVAPSASSCRIASALTS